MFLTTRRCSSLGGDHMFFFFNDTATTEIYTLSLHDALPICGGRPGHAADAPRADRGHAWRAVADQRRPQGRSEEHTSELQSQSNLVCRLLLEKKKTPSKQQATSHLHSSTLLIASAIFYLTAT